MRKFKSYKDIPDFPGCSDKEAHKKACDEFIAAGALPKSALAAGAYYLGGCRNSSIAYWDGRIFHYWRRKFGSSFDETINHFEDDDGFDLFVPFKIIKL